MTVCIGMLASDGIVIAADSQESDQYLKRAQQKIVRFIGNVQSGEGAPPPQMACALTGAGEAGYLDAFFNYALRGVEVDATSRDLEDFFSDKLHSFYQQHIFPLSANGYFPQIQVLIGAYSQWQTCMFVSYGSTLRHAFPHIAIGVGAHFALSIMDELVGIADLRHTELRAAYIIAATKERIEGCGKYTDIVSLHNSAVSKEPEKPAQLIRPSQPLTCVPWQSVRRQLFLLLDDNYFSLSTTITL